MSFRILIADDHGVIRAGLHALLDAEAGMEVVGEASDSQEAVRMASQLAPDIILMDISMPGDGGIKATQKICAANPAPKVLILTIHEDQELLKEALRCGASGYILKQAVKSELINAIQAVARGELYVHSAMTRALLGRPEKAPARRVDTTLTLREVEILRLIAKGYTNSQIAQLLSISVRTVEFHRSNLMDKLGVESRVGLVRYAEEHGIT
ncbi:MAG TPA: response regulator transcription factor [Anaerolineaceae bacterium]